MKRTEHTTNLEADDTAEATDQTKPAARPRKKSKQDHGSKDGPRADDGRALIEVTQFDFLGRQVGSMMKDGQPWFIAKDVCDMLEHSNSRMAVAGLDDDEKGVRIVALIGFRGGEVGTGKRG